MLIVLLTLVAVAVIPITIGYYLWLARSVGPHLVSLPIRLAITILAVWVTLPWIALTAAVWLVWG